jgi:cation transport ATPase
MCMLLLTSDHSIAIEPIAKLLKIDEMKLGFKPKDKFN